MILPFSAAGLALTFPAKVYGALATGSWCPRLYWAILPTREATVRENRVPFYGLCVFS